MIQLQTYSPSAVTLKLRAQSEFALPPTPLCQQQWAAAGVFLCELSYLLHFLQKFHSYLAFFQFNSYGPTWDRPKLSSQTEFGLPSPTTMFPTTKGSDWYIFEVSYHVLHIFYKCFIAMS